MNKIKVVFLDIDGVLNSADNLTALHYVFRSKVHKGLASYPIPKNETRDEYGQYFDERCKLHLESLINFTDAKIVISSTWRKSKEDGLQNMKNLWEYRDLPGEIIGITPILNMDRGQEIQAYLDEHDYIDEYVVIDDDIKDIQDYHPNNFVKCNGYYGLTHIEVLRAREILTGVKDF